MKKILVITLSLVIISGLCACGNKNTDNPVDDVKVESNADVEGTNKKDKEETSAKTETTVDDVKKTKETAANLFDYDEVEGGISIKDYTGDDKIVVIPEKIDGKVVVEVGANAFINNEDIKAVKLSDSIEVIKEQAFVNCESLEIFISGKGLKTIEPRVFLNNNLKCVELNEGLETLEISCFGFLNTMEIEMPSTVTNVDLPFLVNDGHTVTIVCEKGSAMQQYLNSDECYDGLVWKEK